MPRALASAVITFGLVSIPVKLYVSASAEGVSFCMLTPKGNRVKQCYVDSVTNDPVTHDECDKGYEVAKNEFIRFSKDEIKALEAECASKSMEIQEFVEAASVDPVHIEKTYYLGPDKGGDLGVALLSETMAASGKAAVAQWNSRGKENLVVIRPYKGGLILHQMFYANEVRNFDEIEVTKRRPITDGERSMATKLIQTLATGDLDTSQYQDGFIERVQQAVERKLKGTGATTAAEPAKTSQPLDLLAALQASLDGVPKIVKRPKTPKKVG